MMNGDQYYRLKEVGQRAFTQEEIDAHNAGISTDWLDLVLDNGHKQDHQLSVRGGSARTGFALSANYYNEQGVLETQDFNRYTFRINIDHKASDRLRVGTSTQVTNMVQNYGTNPYGGATNISPLTEPYDANGDLVYRPGADPLLWNPLADYVEGNYVDERNRWRIFSNIYAELDILKNLEYRLNFAPQMEVYRRGLFQGRYSSARQGDNARVRKEHERGLALAVENILTYKLQRDNHDLTVTGLYSIEQVPYYEKTHIEAENIPYETQLFHNLGTAETVREFGSDLEEWGLMSFMGRVNYELMGKYMITLTGRWDGSSRLAEGDKWRFFPSVAALWRINAESFMQGVPAISDLRLRVSYGMVGNTAIDPYQTRGSLSRTVYSFAGNAAYGYRPGSISNPELGWENSATANLGLDFGFMDNRIAGTFELYQTHTTDLLLERQIPITSGFNSVFENIGETMNKGWELSLVTRNIATGDFSWETTLNLFGNKEEILDLYGTEEDDVGNEWFIGEPLTVWYDYEKIGIWQLGEEAEAGVYNLEPGEIHVKDQNNDGLINQDDKVILGSDIPTITIGLGSRFGYKGFDFSFLVLGVFGHTVYNNFEVSKATLQGRYNNLNVDFWTETNPTNDHPKPDGSVEYPLYSSSRAYQPGDFFKIKNLQLG
jgi:TonB-linked SusC/RagA family outer membrane protein